MNIMGTNGTEAKSKPGLGFGNRLITTRSTNVIRNIRFWNDDHSILTLWIQQRYIESRAFADIQAKKTIDSAFWKFFMSANETYKNVWIVGLDTHPLES